MTAPFRFLGLALFAWVGVRAASLGYFPGATSLVPPAHAATSAVQGAVQRQVSLPYDDAMASSYASHANFFPPQGYPAPYYPAAYPLQPAFMPSVRIVQPGYPSDHRLARTNGWDSFAPMPQPLAYEPIDNSPWPLPTGIGPLPESVDRRPAAAPPLPQKFDRWQFSTWAMMRNSPGGTGLATGGMLGGSQGGARLTFRFNRNFALAARFSSALGGRRGAEAALGLRWQPLASVPVALNIERRQGLGRFGGRTDFAAFVEGGLYRRPIAGKLTMDGYAQAGMVGHKSRDWFADGALTVSHPIWKRFSGGVGIWGGGQKDQQLGALYRVDAGPRLSVDLYRGTRLHLDYRQRLTGNALPGSGPTVTFAGDF